MAERLGLAHGPSASAIGWVGDGPKVPVEVAATGPKTIGIAARHADRIMLAVGAEPKRIAWGMATARQAAQEAGRDPDTLAFGAEPKRIAWGMATARQAAQEAGRDPDTLAFGAYVNVVCDDDVARGRDLGRAGTGLFARFSVMYGEISGPADAQQAEVFRHLHERYDMTAHGQRGGQQTTALTDGFIDRYAIIGTAEHCAARLTELAELGIGKFAVTGPNFAAPLAEARAAATRFVAQVMPRLKTDTA